MRLWVAGLLLLAPAFAATLRISGGDRLELRTVTLPDGSTVDYVILTGSPVTLSLDQDQTLIAEHIEIDRSSRVVRVIGYGSFRSGGETIAGYDLVVELDAEIFSGREVLIVTEAIDVIGLDAERVPGQIDVRSGRFSPCSRCAQPVQDYGFRAERLTLYPGDRLIAYGVTLLIRELPVAYLPLLVVPLAPPERQPRFSISSGSATRRAEIALDWPYVAGSSAYGTASLRYYADVAPGQGGALGNALLGGRVLTSYLGGGFDHYFFTEAGRGQLRFFYTPAFIDPSAPGGKSRDQFQVRFRYESELERLWPQVTLLIERDDARRQRLVEYDLTLRSQAAGLQGSFRTRGFIDLDVSDTVSEPAYGAPRRTVAQLELSPQAPEFRAGPLQLSDLSLDLGIFEDRASSRRLGEFTAQGRLLARYRALLEPVSLWPGLTLSGNTAFGGQYYGSGERLIAWDTELSLRQGFGIGELSLQFNRTIREGETPFTFDAIGLGNVIDLQSALSLRPAPWLRLTSSQRTVFVDERRPDAAGPGPLITTLALFDNLAWIDLELRNSYDLREGDPGTLDTRLTLRAPSRDVDASLSLNYLRDLNVTEDRLGLGLRDESRIGLEYRFGVAPYGALRVRGGYTFNPRPPAAPGEVADFYDPLLVELTLGRQNPRLNLSYEHDLNRRQPNRLAIDLSAQLTPVELRLQQTIDYRLARVGGQSPPWSSLFSVRWRGVASVELRGAPLVPLGLVGLERSPTAIEPWSLTLIDDLSGLDWRLTYQFRRDASLNAGRGGIRDRSLDLLLNVGDTQLGGVRLSGNFSARWLLADDLRLQSYLASSNLGISADLYTTVGLSGRLAYSAVAQELGGEQVFTTRRLTIDNLAIAVRLVDQLYLAAIFNDVWNLLDTARVTPQSPFNIQPELRLIWDRCCWALYGSWDTATGAITLRLTTPGGSQGLPLEFDSGLRLPGRSP